MSELPTVDIVIAGRNESRRLGDCLQSLTTQDYPSDLLRVIYVDDASTDGSASIAGDLGVTVLPGAGKGQGAARNLGIAHGTGALLGFLDAHVIADPGWVKASAAAFAEPRLGCCMGSIEMRAEDPKVDRWITTVEYPGDHLLKADCVSAARSMYPWAPSTAAMYRRAAVEAIGGFVPDLAPNEDLDLAWQIVLAGYSVAHVPGARCRHYEQRPWPSYLYKGFPYGRAGARIAWRYREHGADRIMRPNRTLGASLGETVSHTGYFLGWRLRWREMLRDSRIRPEVLPVNSHPIRRGTPHLWTTGKQIAVSDAVIYWYPDPGVRKTVVVHVPSRVRYILEEVGDMMWRGIAEGRNRADVANILADTYGIDAAMALDDLDEFVTDFAGRDVLTLTDA